ncbi:ABC transporter ATP-binding protein [uncultured Rhodoblastus sp.]|uniref:ABC transporter ATP-binding protein n=1 Tax=uncultured Rhodoblastus sp. TaxID=543037 RepID=UPI0025F738F8|nr:ABC transporter ATP-binding protein [uncultured Rhodoblastus sp.]
MTSALVALRDLRLSFRAGAPVLDGLDLDVLGGETLCLLGPSGCGKSTLLRVIAGLEQPDAGDLVWSDDAARKKIGFVFQEPNLMPWADIWANVYLPLRLAGVSRRAADPLVRDALARVGLLEAAKSLPRELSGGMKMRVSVARALVDRPSLLLLDEPFAALDEITRWQLNDVLHDLRRESAATIVFVTHSVYESAYLADRVAVMRARPGQIDALLAFPRSAAPGPQDRRGVAFAENCGAIADALEQAMRKSGP